MSRRTTQAAVNLARELMSTADVTSALAKRLLEPGAVIPLDNHKYVEDKLLGTMLKLRENRQKVELKTGRKGQLG